MCAFGARNRFSRQRNALCTVELQVGAEFRIGSDLPDVSIDPIVEQAGSSKEGEDKLVAQIRVTRSDSRLQDKSRNEIKNQSIDASQCKIGQPSAVYERREAVLSPLLGFTPILVLVIEPDQAMVLDIVKNRS